MNLHFQGLVSKAIDAPEVYVPATETPRWTRTCRICGLKQHTDKTTKHITTTPKF